MITKIKETLKSVSVFHWVVLGIALLGLWVGINHFNKGFKKELHKAEKVTETVAETK